MSKWPLKRPLFMNSYGVIMTEKEAGHEMMAALIHSRSEEIFGKGSKVLQVTTSGEAMIVKVKTNDGVKQIIVKIN
jgi:hypothetical protein